MSDQAIYAELDRVAERYAAIAEDRTCREEWWAIVTRVATLSPHLVVYFCRQVTAATDDAQVLTVLYNRLGKVEEQATQQERTLRICVEGGVVQDVENLPEGWNYEIDDRDSDRDEGEDIETFTFDPPLQRDGRTVSEIHVHQYDGETYDLFDQAGLCWNEGDPFYDRPTRELVSAYIVAPAKRGTVECFNCHTVQPIQAYRNNRNSVTGNPCCPNCGYEGTDQVAGVDRQAEWDGLFGD